MEYGRFIVLEGGEGAGKSSAMKMLEAYLPRENTVFTREPGGTPLAQKIRQMLLQEAVEGAHTNVIEEPIEISPLTHFALFWAARRAHVEEIIAPALKAGRNVVCDRFDASTWAYQIWGQEQPELIPLFRMMREHFVIRDARPYLYVYLDVEPEVGIARTKRRGIENEFDKKTIEFYKRVQRGYREFLGSYPCRSIDANRPEPEVSLDVLEVVMSALA
ncbi:MAG: dTMP kinase [Parcubacteria group bacterium]|nr:dTMP kinase [Parcubacteria group bacterium]